MARLPKPKKHKSLHSPKRKRGGKVYDKRWDKQSAFIRRSRPTCEHPGCTNPSQSVDHVIEIKRGGSMYDPRNHMALCNKHHDKKTAKAAYYMYDYLKTPTGLIPKKPLHYIRVPDEIRRWQRENMSKT